MAIVACFVVEKKNSGETYTFLKKLGVNMTTSYTFYYSVVIADHYK